MTHFGALPSQETSKQDEPHLRSDHDGLQGAGRRHHCLTPGAGVRPPAAARQTTEPAGGQDELQDSPCLGD